jgi:hypothetical protein
MKKQRRRRPKYKKARPAPIAKPENEMHSSTIGTGQTSSTVGTGQLGLFRTSNASVDHPPTQLVEPKSIERPPAQVMEPKRIELSDRGMSKARGWGVFAVMIISWLLLAGVVVLFATHWT